MKYPINIARNGCVHKMPIRMPILSSRVYGKSNSEIGGNSENNHIKIPDPPVNCCMSGCANCVWIEYAEELTKILGSSGENIREIILKQVEDPNMKAFLAMELKSLDKRHK